MHDVIKSMSNTNVDNAVIEFKLKDCGSSLPIGFVPSIVFHPIETFIELVEQELKNLKAEHENVGVIRY